MCEFDPELGRPAVPGTAGGAQEATVPGPPGCPVEEVRPDGRHPCVLLRGHVGAEVGLHEFASTRLPDEDGSYDAEGKWHPAGEPGPGDVSDLDEGGAQEAATPGQALPPLPEKWAGKTQGHVAAEAHDRSLFGDETPVPWGDPMSPAVIAWEAAAEAVAAPLRDAASADKRFAARMDEENASLRDRLDAAIIDRDKARAAASELAADLAAARRDLAAKWPDVTLEARDA